MCQVRCASSRVRCSTWNTKGHVRDLSVGRQRSEWVATRPLGSRDATRPPLSPSGEPSQSARRQSGPWPRAPDADETARTRGSLSRPSVPAGFVAAAGASGCVHLAGPVPRETTPTLVDQGFVPVSASIKVTERRVWPLRRRRGRCGQVARGIAAKSAGRPGVHPVSAARDRCARSRGSMERHIHRLRALAASRFSAEDAGMRSPAEVRCSFEVTCTQCIAIGATDSGRGHRLREPEGRGGQDHDGR